MTPEEEVRIFTGPWPWELPGVVIMGTGAAISNVPPKDQEHLSKKARDLRQRFRRLQEETREETENLSLPERRATIEMTRDELALRWAQLKRTGEKLQGQYQQFKEWMGERLQDVHRDEPKGAEHPRSDLIYGLAQIGIPTRNDQWKHVIRQSHLGGAHGLTRLRRQARMFNTLSGRYQELRGQRFTAALGHSEPDLDEYDPSPTAKRLLDAIATLDEERGDLAEADHKTAIFRIVHDRLNNGESTEAATKRLNQALRSDMERKGHLGRFPETPKELVALAREVSQRWDNVGPPFEPPN